MANDLGDVDLQIERDAISMTYSPWARRDDLACIIFEIALNRDTQWAKNPGAFCARFCKLHQYISFTGITWRGKIGIKFDTSHARWSTQTYQDLLTSLTSVFIARDHFPKSYEPLSRCVAGQSLIFASCTGQKT
jgi:hypothetical protein